MNDALRSQLEANPGPLMVTMTTEHYTLGMARSQTITEVNGRATIFVAALTSGLVAQGFLEPSGTTFEVFALVLFPTLAFLGLVTFHRVLQNSIEDLGYAYRIDLCRRFYVDAWPMLAPYLYRPGLEQDSREPSHSGKQRLFSWQLLLTVSGTIGVLTGLLLGAFGAVVSRTLIGSPIGVAFGVGAAFAALSIFALHRQQRRAFARADFSQVDAQMHRLERS